MTNDKVSTCDALDAIYRSLPEISCQRKCSAACGPILCSVGEWQRVKEKLGTVPPVVGLNCPVLLNGECQAYAVRPLICRLYGLVKAMRCPHGCKPKRWLSDAEARHLIQEVERIAGNVGGPALEMVPLAAFEAATD